MRNKMDESSYFSLTSKLCMYPLRDDSNITAFKTLEGIIRTCIGPNGKLKAIQNASGGLVTVTSSSQRLFSIISIKNAFLKLITSSTKIHLKNFNDNGLCCTLLSLKLINNSLSSANYPLPVIGKLLEYLGRLFVEFLSVNQNSCIHTMNMSNLTYFQSIILSVLHSKPGCILRDEDKQHLCILLMKSYFNCISSSLSTSWHKNINFVTLESVTCDQSSLYEGLLVRLPETFQKINTQLYSRSSIKIVLFTTSLSGDADFSVDSIEVTDDLNVWNAVLINMKNAVQKLINDEIHILACQKVVHPSLRKQLEDSNILVLDRLGYETAKHLEFVSGASNSSLFEEPSFGYLTNINQVTIGKKSLLLLSNEANPFWTMLLCNFNEQAVNETKVVCQQVIGILICLLKKPFVCFGAGCTEVHTCKLVIQKVLQTLDDIQCEIDCKTSEILEALQIFQQSIVELSVAFHQGSSLNFVTETVFGHLWKLRDGNFPSENDKCVCGQFSANLVNSSDWEMFTKCTFQAANVDFFPVKPDGAIDKSVILDELSSKVNAYSLAFETASLLLRVSVCVSN